MNVKKNERQGRKRLGSQQDSSVIFLMCKKISIEAYICLSYFLIIERYFLKSNSDFYYSTEKTMSPSKENKKVEMSFEENRFEFVEKFCRKPKLDKVRVDKS